MTDQELRDLIASLGVKTAELAESQARTDRQMQETDRQMKETDRRLQETDQYIQETGRQVREQGRQLGGLGDKFGSFTEGLALPAMTRILTEDFGMTFVAPRVRVRKDGRSLEVDVLAYSNSGLNAAFVVEVKSHLREDSLVQMRSILRDFRHFFPEHADKKVYGILAAVDAPEDIREKVLAEGIYLARVHDEQFELQVPEKFQPRAY